MLLNIKKITTYTCKFTLLILFALIAKPLFAQESADKILAVVGRNRIILQSELELQTAQAKHQDPKFNDTMKCFLLQQMILQKMLMEQAERDSVMVTDEDVEGQLENRIRYFTQLYGSKERLEQLSGKSIYQMKEEFRENIKEQMIAEKMQGQILEPVKITPAEVSAFYKRIPKDSLPFFPAIVEVGQIVIDPPVSKEMYEFAYNKIEGIRNGIINDGKNFETMVAFYSQDPGTRDNGGKIEGVTRNSPLVPEFLAAVFKLQNGEISPIIKTRFGYHIIKMISRKGDEAEIAHILIKPEVTSADFKKALSKLDSVYQLLTTGKMTFQEAVGKFSTDEAAKRTGGMIADPNTGVSELDMSKLDPGMVRLLDTMKIGGYSAPQLFTTETREQSCRIVYLRTRTSPHAANLKDDYNRIMEVALSQKKQQKIQTWVTQKLPTYYLMIDPEYQTCQALKDWKTTTDKAK